MNELILFNIITCPDRNYRFVIFSTSGINPLSVIPDIEKELTKRNGSGYVLFDLLLSNGETSNRYLSAFFDGTRLCPDTFKTVQSLPKAFKKIASEYYARNKSNMQLLLGKSSNQWI